jgi:hypothetical protein
MMGGSNVYNIYHSGGGGGGNNNNNTTNKSNPSGGNKMPKFNRTKGKGNGRNNGGGSGGSGGGNGGGGNSNYSSNGGGIINPPSNAYPMDPSDQKMVSTFSSGIIGGMTGTSSYASGNNSSPLYDMGIRFNALGTSSKTNDNQDSYTYKQWENIVFPAYVQYIQRNLNYQFTLNEDEFGEYIEAVSDALQLFYTIESIMAYANNPDTVNDAVYSLRSKISANMYNDMYLLKERLEQMVIPPAIHEMI